MSSKSQVTIMTEDFETFTNDILVSNITPTNGWYQSVTTIEYTENPYGCQSGTGVGTHNCGTGCLGCYRHLWTAASTDWNITNKSLGICGWYTDGVSPDGPYGTRFSIFKGLASDKYVYKYIDFTLWKNIKLKFDWQCGGEFGDNLGDDFGGVYLIDNNNILYQFSSARSNSVKFAGQVDVVTDTLSFPTLANGNNNVFIAFNYECDADTISYAPSFVIDNLVLTACPNTAPVISANTSIAIGASTTLSRNSLYASYAAVTYQWQKSTDNLTWTNITGTTSLNTGALYKTTYYRCFISAGTACDTLYSNTVTVTVPVCSTPALVAPTCTQDEICKNDAITLNINAITSGSNCGTWEYAWYNDSTKQYWNGTSYASATPVYSATYTSVTFIPENLHRYKNMVRCSSYTDCADTSDYHITTQIYDKIIPTFSLGDTIQYTLGDTPAALPTTSTNGYSGTWSPNVVSTATAGVFNYVFTLSNSDWSADLITNGICTFENGIQNLSLDLLSTPPTNAWASPSTCTSAGGWEWGTDGQGNPGKYAYVTNEAGYNCFFRSVEMNCSGMDTVTMTFDLKNTAVPSGGYIYVGSVWTTAYKTVPISINNGAWVNTGASTGRIDVNTARTDWETITVRYDISSLASKSSVLFYIYTSTGNSSTYKLMFDNFYLYSGNHVYASTPCAQTYTQLVKISQPIKKEVTVTSCNSYTWVGETYTVSCDTTRTFKTTENKDSIVTLHLTINQSKTSEFTVVICDNYIWDGIVYDASGDYQKSYTTIGGCDSIVTLHLTINYKVNTDIYKTACDFYEWNGKTFAISGDYIEKYTMSNGCDSIVTLHLTINSSPKLEVTATACDVYTWEGNNYIVSGDYIKTKTSTTGGCDTIVTLHLTIFNSTGNEIWAEACNVYTWNGKNYIVSGDYEEHYTRPYTICDSVVILHLNILEPYLEIDSSHSFCDENYTILTARTNLPNIKWSTGETTPSITVRKPDIYYVEASGACTETAYIEIEKCNYALFLPTAITPNSPTVNQYFSLNVSNDTQINAAEIAIYNRWGSLVFTSNSMYFKWDGREKGKVHQNSIYTYVLKVKYKDGNDQRYTGTITVL